MKKAYSKPVIYFESFSLSQSIAAGCEVISDTPGGVTFGPFVLFFDAEGSACTGDGRALDQGGDGEKNGICYHVFSNNGKWNLFNS